MLTGFLLAPMLGYSVVCAYCNFNLLYKFSLGLFTFDVGFLTSTNIITMFLWLVVLGAFTKGGRGFCSYVCPVGATQSLLHTLGAKLSFTYKLAHDPHKCISCGLCSKECPTGALRLEGGGLSYQRISCLTCSQCLLLCPKKALKYARGADGWENQSEEKDSVLPYPEHV
jgi:ferredoxin